MTRHTPGPWIARQYSNGLDWGIDAPFGDTRHPLEDYSGFATIYGSENYPRQGAIVAEANARLIAAAPDLLYALMEAVASGLVPKTSASEGGASKYARQVLAADNIRTAIAKATGESNEP
jgi:hypothetical protein